MDKKLAILIVEDDTAPCRNFLNLIENSQTFSLTGITDSATEAVDNIKNNLPDIVILDLELHSGQGSGLDVLNTIKKTTLPKTPYFLITTNNSSPVTYDAARQLGADYIIAKHQKDYSEKQVLSFLEMISSSIRNNIRKSQSPDFTEISPVAQQKLFTRRIISELNMVGINPKSVGYKYLVDAIFETINDSQPNLCDLIAKKYSKTSASVERAMQNAINRAWATSDINDLLNCYTAKINSDKGVPTLTEFIFYYANKIRTEL